MEAYFRGGYFNIQFIESHKTITSSVRQTSRYWTSSKQIDWLETLLYKVIILNVKMLFIDRRQKLILIFFLLYFVLYKCKKLFLKWSSRQYTILFSITFIDILQPSQQNPVTSVSLFASLVFSCSHCHYLFCDTDLGYSIKSIKERSICYI